ncbi:PilN domain-containing protein [Acinetobacter rudis]|uniref:PilN domain-containing protein n=1 Tax=Acinetobacter rudis TaxID=632955 RepID=UPI003340F7D7
MKAEINLLPWREQYHQQLKKQFIVISSTVTLFALFLLLLIWSYQTYKLEDLVESNQLISSTQQELELQLKHVERLNTQHQVQLQQMQLLHTLQGQRPVTARLMDELVRLLPTDIYINKLHRSANTLTLEGRAAHPHAVATLLHRLESSIWFQHALMRSFDLHAPATLPQPVFERHEERYGHFVVTVDLGNIALDQPKAQSP